MLELNGGTHTHTHTVTPIQVFHNTKCVSIQSRSFFILSVFLSGSDGCALVLTDSHVCLMINNLLDPTSSSAQANLTAAASSSSSLLLTQVEQSGVMTLERHVQLGPQVLPEIPRSSPESLQVPGGGRGRRLQCQSKHYHHTHFVVVAISIYTHTHLETVT